MGWDHMAQEENPRKINSAASWVVAGAAAGPVSFISRCLGLCPHMVSRRFQGLPLSEAAGGSVDSRGLCHSEPLKLVDFSFYHTHSSPQSPEHPFKGCLLTGNGEEGGPRVGGRAVKAYEQGLLCIKGTLSCDSGRHTWATVCLTM